jgi:membrane-bound lytic murein transglycosylase D
LILRPTISQSGKGSLSIFLMIVVLLAASCDNTSVKKASAAPASEAEAPEINDDFSRPFAHVQQKSAQSSAPQAIPQKSTATAFTTRFDPAESLIASVEKEYQAGRAEYNAGHLESAKRRFDHAFDMLVSSSLDVRQDDRLQQEFDKIVEGIHTLEVMALKQGDGFTERNAEPAPIDEANEITFPVDPNIKAQAEEEVRNTHSDLPLTLNDAVASYIGYFSGRGRGTLERALMRSGRYKDMIQRVLKEEGVPQDLIYLAQAESGFQPLALSNAGARGMWQFVAGRASLYGLERNWWIDERMDPEKSTRAAARHLKDLYNEFGDWYLAMAAYNSGPGTVQNAVRRTGYADYWELYRRLVLPQETRNYVPIILAVTIIAKNPAQYGLDHLILERPVATDVVRIDYPVDLRLVAECVDSSASELQELNPSLLRMTTPKDQPFELHLPAGAREKYLAAIEAIPPDMRVWWHYHRVAPGDTLGTVARKYHTTPQAIAEVNNLNEDEALRAESKLIIPVTPGHQKAADSEAVSSAASQRSSGSRKSSFYKVRRGDTATSVADDFGVPVASLRAWNHLNGNALRAGRTLVIHASSPDAGPNSSKREHAESTAKRSPHKGSTSSSTGNRASRSAHSEEVSSTRQASARSRSLRHTVKKGETLAGIADAYGTTVAELKKQNRKVASNLRAGAVLVIKPGE